MQINLAIADPNLSELWSIIRQNGAWGPGGWVITRTQNISAYGTVGLATPKEISQLPEADRVHAARSFFTNQPLYTTRSNSEDGDGISDIMLYDNEKWRVMSAFPYRNRGYWKAIAVRMLGT